MPLRHVLPKPVQKPHPPLWIACSQLDTIEARRSGMGALGFQFVTADAAHAWVHAYYNAFAKRQKKLADYVINPNIALVSFFMCAKTDEEARARADGDTFFQFALRFYGASQRPQAPAARHGQHVGRVQQVEARQSGGAGGGAARRPDRLARHDPQEAAPVPRPPTSTRSILLNQAGKNTHEHICESLELFAKEVMPEFQGRSASSRWKEG